MQLYTPVALPPDIISLDIDSKVMMLGSCFAENVGERLKICMGSDGVDVNPFGVLYNPASIAQALQIMMDRESIHAITDGRFIFHGQDGVWHSWLHSSRFSDNTQEGCIEKTVSRLVTAQKMLREATLLCVTFGTTRHYVHDGIVVANCHKEPQRCFTEKEQTLDELTALWEKIISELREFNPGLNICFTVSPYRYKKYGFHESQIQKAKLLLLCDHLCHESSATKESGGKVAYFPSYEILLDELRDYRFYKEDMLHPSGQAVDIIAERFMDWSFSPRLMEESVRRQKEHRLSQHRKLL
ncbi:MAG: GSCFA domain-containing protein [Bacteroidales bacterium]|nr:GSCFA domain-containing protein [Bacteroidales bacterium]MCM1148267.1 GSCFA domain-containing protein [Bacteroidales bacterium]MCM1206590.1 GSCFA domain-containing protein [Bacillota bacterium]MCM1510508.1 GSCFA domain-containing protein [Clostridium sp.]